MRISVIDANVFLCQCISRDFASDVTPANWKKMYLQPITTYSDKCSKKDRVDQLLYEM